MSVAYISHPDCLLHDMGQRHPERPARLAAINDRLIASGLDMALHHYSAPLVERELLEAVHDPDYVASVFDASPEQELVWLDGDTAMGKYSLSAALRAAGLLDAVALGANAWRRQQGRGELALRVHLKPANEAGDVGFYWQGGQCRSLHEVGLAFHDEELIVGKASRFLYCEQTREALVIK